MPKIKLEKALNFRFSLVSASHAKVGWMTAGGESHERKVRALQSMVLANGQAGRPDGKCNREKTANRRFFIELSWSR